MFITCIRSFAYPWVCLMHETFFTWVRQKFLPLINSSVVDSLRNPLEIKISSVVDWRLIKPKKQTKYFINYDEKSMYLISHSIFSFFIIPIKHLLLIGEGSLELCRLPDDSGDWCTLALIYLCSPIFPSPTLLSSSSL